MKIHLRLFGLHLYISDHLLRNRNRRVMDIDKATKWRIRETVYARAGGKCELCGKPVKQKSFSLHHIVPLSMGSNELSYDNMQCLCPDCHKDLHCNVLKYAEQIKEYIDKKKGQSND